MTKLTWLSFTGPGGIFDGFWSDSDVLCSASIFKMSLKYFSETGVREAYEGPRDDGITCYGDERLQLAIVIFAS